MSSCLRRLDVLRKGLDVVRLRRARSELAPPSTTRHRPTSRALCVRMAWASRFRRSFSARSSRRSQQACGKAVQTHTRLTHPTGGDVSVLRTLDPGPDRDHVPTRPRVCETRACASHAGGTGRSAFQRRPLRSEITRDATHGARDMGVRAPTQWRSARVRRTSTRAAESSSRAGHGPARALPTRRAPRVLRWAAGVQSDLCGPAAASPRRWARRRAASSLLGAVAVSPATHAARCVSRPSAVEPPLPSPYPQARARRPMRASPDS